MAPSSQQQAQQQQELDQMAGLPEPADHHFPFNWSICVLPLVGAIWRLAYLCNSDLGRQNREQQHSLHFPISNVMTLCQK